MTTLVYGSHEWLHVVSEIKRAEREERDIVFTPSMPAIFLGESAHQSEETDHRP